MLDAAISDSSGPVTSLQILHLPLVMSLSILSTTSRHIDSFLEVVLIVHRFHVGGVVGLSSLIERGLFISAKQVSVVVTQVGITRVDVSDLGLRSGKRLCIFTSPDVAHHDFKVSVCVDVSRHMCVVFNKFFRSYSTIVGTISDHVEMVFKSTEPFSHYFIFCLLSRLHIGVHSAIELAFNIF